jgi:hypothetical protein
MANSWIVDIRHFMAPTGAFAPELPNRARILAEYCGEIVAQATNYDEPTTIRCRRRPQRRACNGLLSITFDERIESVLWHCPQCGDNGVIRGWQETFWDNSDMQSESA